MGSAVNHRDLLLCVLAREQQCLNDDQLRETVEQWLQHEERSLLDVLAGTGFLSTDRLARLQAAADARAAETCLDPLTSHLRSLPRPVRTLLETAATAVDQFETAPNSDKASSPGAMQALATLPADDRFSIVQLQAQGGLGVIFQARDAEIDRTVALKQIKPQWADDSESRNRFVLEAKITGRLEHPGIVPIYALGADETGRPYYAMRLIRGESFLQVIERFHRTHATVGGSRAQRTVQLRKLLDRFIDVCNALEYAHSHGIVHRDIKPANVMVGKFGETLVVDWGLAKVIGADEEAQPTSHQQWTPLTDADSTSTRMGAAVGTPAYMSPEQALGRLDEIGPASDVYSLGATLYQLLTGVVPHAEKTDLGVLITQIEAGQVIPPVQRASWLPRPLSAICMRALAVDPIHRYRSARALADDLERWLADEPVNAHEESASERAFRWMRNHRTLVISLAAAQVVAAVAAVVGLAGWNHFQARRLEDKLAMEQQQQQRQMELAASASSATQSATAEIRANRFPSALTFLSSAADALREHPELTDELKRTEAKQERIRQLVNYYDLTRSAEESIALQYDADARRKLLAALDSIKVFSRGDWWDHLPTEDLSPQQRHDLRQDVYRQLILLTANYAKGAFGNLMNADGAVAARNTLAVAERVQRYRPASSSRWHASCARFRLGRGLPLRVSQLDPPENGPDAYTLGALAAIASQNPKLAAFFTVDPEGLLEQARRDLSLASALEPQYYWTHFALGYAEMLAAGDPTTTPPAVSRPHYQNARRAFSQSIAIDPSYWLAYAERCNSYRQEIESRRAAGVDDQPLDGETSGHLQEMMIRDLEQLRRLDSGHASLHWYVGFALYTAGQINASIDAMMTAIEQGTNFDIDGNIRILDPEGQRALPEALQIADQLLQKEPDNPRFLLLRAGANARLGNLDNALEDVDRVLQAPMPPAFAHFIRGSIWLQRGQSERAEADFLQALQTEPELASGHIGLARSLEARNNFAESLKVYDRAAAHANTSFQKAAIQLGRGAALLARGDAAEALDAIAAARRAQPSCNVTSIRNLARQQKRTEFLAQLDELVEEPAIEQRDALLSPTYDTLPLLNGDFELQLGDAWNNRDIGDTAWHNEGGSRSTAEVVHDAARQGRVLYLKNDAKQGFGVTSQTMPAEPGARYRLSVWARGRQLTQQAVQIVVDDQRDEPIVELPVGTYAWRQLLGQFEVADHGASVREGLTPVTIRILSAGVGEAWLDDLRIERIPAEDEANGPDA